MARDFLAIPFAAYQGGFTSRPFNNRRGGQSLSVLANVRWFTYNIGGQHLGTANPQFQVLVDLNAAASNVVSQTWRVQSIYIDNEGCNFPVYVRFPDTQHVVSCPENSSGWYQVFTTARQAFIAGLGITDIDFANQATTNVFFTDAEMVPYLDQEFPSAVMQGSISPSISFGGTGGQILGIGVVVSGTCFTSAGLSITGGGGTGAAAHGVLDQYGRFTQVIIDNPGQGYRGPPIINATGAQDRFGAYVTGNIYAQGAVVGYQGWLWYANARNATVPGTDGNWSNLGIPYQQPPQFNSSESPISGGSTVAAQGSYGVQALGDQVVTYIDSPQGNGAFRDNIFGTPFASGYIYITNVHVVQLSAPNGNALAWALQDTNDDVVFNFSLATSPGDLLNLQRCNIRLPATSQWRLFVNSITGFTDLSHAFVWTYAQF